MKKFNDIHVAYFSMEIGIDADIPTYSGGLGVLAGDTLRSCADLGVPIIGVTLLYKNGYFRQKIEDGNQVELEINWDPSVMERLETTADITIAGRDVKVAGWLYNLEGISGSVVPILFLDTDLDENSEEDRDITKHLYGSGRDYRLKQEIVLGIGGLRLLKKIGCSSILKYHMNEGHSALLTLELINEAEDDVPLGEIKEKTVFTTHTPVPAGHDKFDESLARSLLQGLVPARVADSIYKDGVLNMSRLGLQFSRYVNGVARKHGEVSRNMFPGYNIESITNGVHSVFWTAQPFKDLFNKYIPGWEQDPFSLRYVLSVPKQDIWEAHMRCKRSLIDFVNSRYSVGLDINTLTIGFARRATSYKRGDLLFTDTERLKKIVEKAGNIQILYAGKAHPEDNGGKDLIKRIINHMGSVKDKIKVCYIEDYDISIAKYLVSGVDVWLNTPMRPREASGTSGMKAAHNGVPHFSVLDGWWLEGHIENITGWSIGVHPDKSPICNNDEDAEDLYMKLEYIILPKFYKERDSWIDVMKHSIAINASFFNTHRMVQQYVLNAYFT